MKKIMRIFAALKLLEIRGKLLAQLWCNRSDAMLRFITVDLLYYICTQALVCIGGSIFTHTWGKNGGNRIPTAVYSSDDCTSYMLGAQAHKHTATLCTASSIRKRWITKMPQMFYSFRLFNLYGCFVRLMRRKFVANIEIILSNISLWNYIERADYWIYKGNEHKVKKKKMYEIFRLIVTA